MAARAGVAISSVSRVLSNHPDVSEPTREKVMKAVEELDYRPNLLAQGLRSQRTMTVGFAVSDIGNSVLSSAVSGAENELRAAGYGLLVTDAEGDPGQDAANLSLLAQRQVDGLIVSCTDEQDEGTVNAMRDAESPMILLDRDLPEGVDSQTLGFDHRSGMREAAQYLYTLGHRRISLISGGPRRPARERREGVIDVFGKGDCEVLEGDFSIIHGEASMTELLSRPEPPTAVLAGGNLLMHGVLQAVHTAGVELGKDLSLIGCDDVAVARFHSPPIAVVTRDTRQMGVEGARLLLQAIAGGDTQRKQDLPTRFVPAPSCGPPR